MPTKLEQLKERLDKQTSKIDELKKSIEDEELSEMQAEELAAKMVNVQEALGDTVKGILEGEGITLPTGKSITITANEDGSFAVSTLAQKPPRKATGATGATRGTVSVPETVEGEGLEGLNDLKGKTASWSQIADAVGISYGGGSAHKAVFTQNKPLHDQIPHENCPYA